MSENRYLFFYDESEHSRVINEATIDNQNYCDSFFTAIVGWKKDTDSAIENEYAEFEKKYSYRASKGEIKSTTIKPNQLKNGFASLNDENVAFLDDLLSLFDERIWVFVSINSKIEHLVFQLFNRYKNGIGLDADAFKYNIIKPLVLYRPEQVIRAIYEQNSSSFIQELIAFYKERIEIDKRNIELKQMEISAYKQAIEVLDQVDSNINLMWDYHYSFSEFSKYLKEISAEHCELFIDREGILQNTVNAAKDMGLDATEIDSKSSFGIRMADMLVGVVAKLTKSINAGLRPQMNNPQKTILDTSWFILDNKRLFLYKKLYSILVHCHKGLYKFVSGTYCDDKISLLALLTHMNQFNSVSDFAGTIDKQGDLVNQMACGLLQRQYARMKNKQPINPLSESEVKQGYFYNKHGAKVFIDILKQPLLDIPEGTTVFKVLSVGVCRNVPIITIEEENGPACYRLDDCFWDWVIKMKGLTMYLGELFPETLAFTRTHNKCVIDYYDED